MKIAFYETAHWEQDYLKKQLSNHNLVFHKNHFTSQQLPDSDIDILSVFTTSKITGAVLQHCPKLKLISTRTTGFDHIDLKACVQYGVTVCSVPDYGQNTVAELTFGLILMVARKLQIASNRVSQERVFSFEGLQGMDLAGKTIGIIGTGKIGSHVASIAKGFQMKVLAYDPFPNDELAKKIDLVYLPLEEVLQSSDIVTIHVPYMRATHHLINEHNILKMKPGSILINTSRGGLVKTSAILKALEFGVLAGVGLDVLEEEGLLSDELQFLTNGHPNAEELKIILEDHALMNLPNVVVLPHIGFHTTEAMKRILDTTIKNIELFIENKPQNIVQDQGM